MKKIGIDARLFGTKHGGIGRYTENLVKQLEKIDNQNQYFIFLQKDNFEDYQPQNKNFKKVIADFRAYSFGEQFKFPILLKKYNLDLLHFTHFNVPILYNRKFIATIHDLIISHHPTSRATTLNPFLYKFKLVIYQLVIRLVARNAKIIIAVSEYTKKDIVKLLKINPKKIIVTYEGVNLPRESDLDCDQLKLELGIDREFLLYVGSAYPHKNLDKLLKAFTYVDNKYQLVLVGGRNYFYERLEEEVNNMNLNERVVFTGYLSDSKLTCLYKKAKLYVFPSLIEGFGLPPLEAQSYGLPVVSSKSTCLPEVLGDSAVYFDPSSSVDISKIITKTLNDQELISDLVFRGYENTKKYSWIVCATETLKLYNKIIK